MLQHSAVCTGKVWHRRHQPRNHAFSYPVYMAWIDCDEVDQLDRLPLWSTKRLNLVQFRREDYLAPTSIPIKDAVVRRLQEQEIFERPARVAVLTNLRNWGLTFNPVTFYVAYRANGDVLAILSEVNNTPWGERYVYVHVIPAGQEGQDRWLFEFDKEFHVSPFMPMDICYRWRFHLSAERIAIHMRLGQAGEHQFDATLRLRKKPLTRSVAWKVPLAYPLMTARVVGGIYWQAMRLWFKKIPFHTHPKKGESC